jgi:uncharacterized protein (DUF1697 family)
VLRYIALLRAINVGGGRTITMASLRRLFESLGFSNVATFIASGNVMFETQTRNAKALERRIEQRLREALGYDVAVFIRTPEELAEIANYRPFPQSKIDSATQLNFVFLADTLDENSAKKVRALRTDTDAFRVHGREIYWLRWRKQDGPAFSTVPLEKILGRTFTIRASKTVKRMAAKYSAMTS